MKNFIIVLFIMMPLFLFGQETEPKKITVEVKSSKTLSADSLSKEFWINCGCKKTNALVLLNDMPLKERESLHKIEIADIKSFSVIKEDDKDLAQYGDKGKNGVIKIEVEDIDKYKELLKEEYDTIVFAPGFESFVTTQPSKSYFTESWLKSKNILMVTEWNYRHSNPSRYNPQIYEEAVDYDSRTDYGIDVEYTLYMFFRFMEKENDMSLIGDRQIAER